MSRKQNNNFKVNRMYFYQINSNVTYEQFFNVYMSILNIHYLYFVFCLMILLDHLSVFMMQNYEHTIYKYLQVLSCTCFD